MSESPQAPSVTSLSVAAAAGARPSKPLAEMLLAFVGIFAALALPSPGLGPLYTQAHAAVANALVPEQLASGVQLRFQARLPEQPPWQVTLAIDPPSPQRRITMPIELRSLAYLPTVAFVALAVATPLGSRKKNAKVLGVGLLILIPLLMFLIALPILSFLGGTGPVRAFSLGLGVHVVLQILYRALVAPPGMAFALPLLLWWTLVKTLGRPSADRSRAPFALAAALVPLVFTLSSGGCLPLDRRTLELASGGGTNGGTAGTDAGSESMAGEASAGTGNASAEGGKVNTGGSAPNMAGTSGTSPTQPHLVGGCVDLNGDQVPDCQQSELDDPEFSASVVEWQSTDGVAISWSQTNSFGERASGSALVQANTVINGNGNGVYAASHCFAVSAGQEVNVFANVFVPPEQIAGLAGLQIWFLSEPDCQGKFVSGVNTPYAERVDEWTMVTASAPVDAQAKSAAIRLALVKPFEAPLFTAHFDNVLLLVQ